MQSKPVSKFLNFIKPDKYTIIVFAILLFIMAGGHIQSYGFDDSEMPAPPLYKELKPFPIWPLWMFLMVPLFILAFTISVPLVFILGNDLTQTIMGEITTGPIAWGVMLVYFYMIACVVSFVLRIIFKK